VLSERNIIQGSASLEFSDSNRGFVSFFHVYSFLRIFLLISTKMFTCLLISIANLKLLGAEENPVYGELLLFFYFTVRRGLLPHVKMNNSIVNTLHSSRYKQNRYYYLFHSSIKEQDRDPGLA
jgi:hypothetical protein